MPFGNLQYDGRRTIVPSLVELRGGHLCFDPADSQQRPRLCVVRGGKYNVAGEPDRVFGADRLFGRNGKGATFAADLGL
jgi:hypothetical protein